MIILTLIILIFNIIVIVKYFSMSNRLDEISANTLNTKNYVKTLTQQNFELRKQFHAMHSAERKQYFYDHCIAANMDPHEWICTGSGPHIIEYTCRKCGQKLLAPRYLDVEPQIMIQPSMNQDEKE